MKFPRAIRTATTNDIPPAGAKEGAVSTDQSPARANLHPEAIQTAPARATVPATPLQGSPARANPNPEAIDASPARASLDTAPMGQAPARADLDTIRTLGALLDDLEMVRVMNGNRIGALEREYGESLPHLDVIQKQVATAEHLAHLELVRAWRRHPLAPWAKEYRGVGEKSIARLVAIIGDPAERDNPAKLWAYCGHGDPRRRRTKGMSQEEAFRLGNPRAKKQVWLIATSLLKAGNREVYDRRREQTKERVHERPCIRCGPSGSPAAAGSPWSDGHKHADALRVAGKLSWLTSGSPPANVPSTTMPQARGARHEDPRGPSSRRHPFNTRPRGPTVRRDPTAARPRGPE